jgi:hypothetical protein
MCIYINCLLTHDQLGTMPAIRRSKRVVRTPERLAQWMTAKCHHTFDRKHHAKTYIPDNARLTGYPVQQTAITKRERAVWTEARGTHTVVKIHPVTLIPYVVTAQNHGMHDTTDRGLALFAANERAKKKRQKRLQTMKKPCVTCRACVPSPHHMWGMSGTYECPVCLKNYTFNKVPGALTCGHVTCERCFKRLPVKIKQIC